MKSFFAGLILILAAASCGLAPSKFEMFEFFGLPGYLVMGALLFVLGLSLWIDELCKD